MLAARKSAGVALSCMKQAMRGPRGLKWDRRHHKSKIGVPMTPHTKRTNFIIFGKKLQKEKKISSDHELINWKIGKF